MRWKPAFGLASGIAILAASAYIVEDLRHRRDWPETGKAEIERYAEFLRVNKSQRDCHPARHPVSIFRRDKMPASYDACMAKLAPVSDYSFRWGDRLQRTYRCEHDGFIGEVRFPAEVNIEFVVGYPCEIAFFPAESDPGVGVATRDISG